MIQNAFKISALVNSASGPQCPSGYQQSVFDGMWDHSFGARNVANWQECAARCTNEYHNNYHGCVGWTFYHVQKDNGTNYMHCVVYQSAKGGHPADPTNFEEIDRDNTYWAQNGFDITEMMSCKKEP